MGNNALQIYNRLLGHYGDLNWWPAETPYGVIVGAVLTQNTAWSNVEKAIASFGGKLTPEFVLGASHDEIAGIIRPAGFFNQKAVYLKAVTGWFSQYGFSVQAVRREPLEKLRRSLLSVKGIGKETADSILLYAFGFPTFVVDAYTMRLCGRFPVDAGNSYDAVKAAFEDALTAGNPSLQNEEIAKIYNNYHAYIVINGKEHCRKAKPLCGSCPLGDICGRIGIGHIHEG